MTPAKASAAPQQERATVFVVDDDPSVRRGLDSFLRSVGFDVRTFASAREFQRAARPDLPAVLVLDVRMPEVGGLEFQRELKELGDEVPIVFITAHGDIPMTVRAIKAGAIEFLAKPFSDEDLLDAIKAGLDKDRARREAIASITDLQRRFAGLTSREREVTALIVSGRRNKQIAAELGVSEITIKVCRGQIMRKMEAGSLAELVRMADKLGISFEKT
jgi:FixJ family two-component response regulator